MLDVLEKAFKVRSWKVGSNCLAAVLDGIVCCERAMEEAVMRSGDPGAMYNRQVV